MKQLSPSFAVLALAIIPCAALGDCPVTLPSSSPVNVPKSASSDSFAWYGSEALAVRLPANGKWRAWAWPKLLRQVLDLASRL